MSNKRLTAELILSTIDKASAPLKKVMQGSGNAAKALKAARTNVKQLNDQMSDVRQYRRTRAQLRLNDAQVKKYTAQLDEAKQGIDEQYSAHNRIKGTLRAAEKRYKFLVNQFEEGKGATQEFRLELDKARMKVDAMQRGVTESSSKLAQYRGKAGHANKMLKHLSTQHTNATKSLQIYRDKLNSAGVGTERLAGKNRELKRAAEGANSELKEQQERLHRLTQIQAKSERINSKAMTLAGYSGASALAGQAALRGMGGLLAPVVTAQASGSLIAARQGQDSSKAEGYTDIIHAIKASGSMAEINDIATTLDSAAAAFGNLGETSSTELQRISRHALNLSSTFGTDTSESIQMAQIMLKNGLAGSADEAFDLITSGMQNVTSQMRGELPEILHEYSTHFRGMGFSGHEAMNLLIQMAEQGKFALDKTGDAIKEFSIRGSDMSKASVEAYEIIGLNANRMSNAIAAGGDDAQKALQDTVKGLLELTDPADRANAAIALFGTPVEDLAIDKIPDFLTALGGAKDVLNETRGAADNLGDTLRDNLQGDIGKLSGSWNALKTQFFDVESGPLRGLVQQLTGVVKEVTGWAKENPRLTGTLVIVAATLATVVTAMGALGLAVSTVMFGWAGLLKMAPMFIRFKRLSLILMTLGKVAFPLVAAGIKTISAALISNPIGIAVTAIAAAAYLIYRNWEPIKAFFTGLWQQVKEAFSGGIAGVGALLLNWSPLGILYSVIQSGLATLGIELPTQFSDFGSMLMQGLINGITGRIDQVREKITSVGSSISGWFKNILGINSPSLVFTNHGADVMAGLQQGLGNGESAVMDSIVSIAGRLMEKGRELAGRLRSTLGDLKNSALDRLNTAGGWLRERLGFDQPELQPAAGGGFQFDNRPALQPRAASARGNSLSIGEIHVHAAPGMDAEAVARMVAIEIQKLQLQQAASTRSQLRDED